MGRRSSAEEEEEEEEGGERNGHSGVSPHGRAAVKVCRFMQRWWEGGESGGVGGGFKFRSGTRWVRELRTHSEEEEEEEVATALGVFVQRSRSFQQKESPTSC